MIVQETRRWGQGRYFTLWSRDSIGRNFVELILKIEQSFNSFDLYLRVRERTFAFRTRSVQLTAIFTMNSLKGFPVPPQQTDRDGWLNGWIRATFSDRISIYKA